MASRFSKLHLDPIDGARSRGLHGVSDMLRDVLAICRRSWAAADHYEDLKSMSDRALADIGLERRDLPRAAFDRLTGEG